MWKSKTCGKNAREWLSVRKIKNNKSLRGRYISEVGTNENTKIWFAFQVHQTQFHFPETRVSMQGGHELCKVTESGEWRVKEVFYNPRNFGDFLSPQTDLFNPPFPGLRDLAWFMTALHGNTNFGKMKLCLMHLKWKSYFCVLILTNFRDVSASQSFIIFYFSDRQSFSSIFSASF